MKPGIWRGIQTRVSDDSYYASLTCREQHIWLQLFHDPHTCELAGLVKASVGTLLDGLRNANNDYTLEEVRKTLLKFEKDARIRVARSWIYVRRSVRYSPPDSSNNAINWRRELENLEPPEIVYLVCMDLLEFCPAHKYQMLFDCLDPLVAELSKYQYGPSQPPTQPPPQGASKPPTQRRGVAQEERRGEETRGESRRFEAASPIPKMEPLSFLDVLENIPTTPNPKPTKPTKTPSPDALSLAYQFVAYLHSFPDSITSKSLSRPNLLDSLSSDFDFALRNHHCSLHSASLLLDWLTLNPSPKSDFWRNQILAPKPLFKGDPSKFQKALAQCLSDQNNPNSQKPYDPFNDPNTPSLDDLLPEFQKKIRDGSIPVLHPA